MAEQSATAVPPTEKEILIARLQEGRNRYLCTFHGVLDSSSSWRRTPGTWSILECDMGLYPDLLPGYAPLASGSVFVVLPAANAYEKAGTFTNTCGDLRWRCSTRFNGWCRALATDADAAVWSVGVEVPSVPASGCGTTLERSSIGMK
jgi:hypothetical protein